MEFLYEISDQIFEEAIKQGILSDDEYAPNFAGNFMYMYTENNVHFFKHISTRAYGHDIVSIIFACE